MGFFTGELRAKPIILLTGVRFVGKLSRDSISTSNKLSAELPFALNVRYRYFFERVYYNFFFNTISTIKKKGINYSNNKFVRYVIMMQFQRQSI